MTEHLTHGKLNHAFSNLVLTVLFPHLELTVFIHSQVTGLQVLEKERKGKDRYRSNREKSCNCFSFVYVNQTSYRIAAVVFVVLAF